MNKLKSFAYCFLFALTALTAACQTTSLPGVIPVTGGTVATYNPYVMVNSSGVVISPENLVVTHGSIVPSSAAYTNASGNGQYTMPVTIGQAYAYIPTLVGGSADGTYAVYITGTNANTTNVILDPGGFASDWFIGNDQKYLSVFIATQSNITFLNLNATSGAVTDTLFPVSVAGYGLHVGTFQGVVMANSYVPDAALSNDVQIQNTRLSVLAPSGGLPNYMIASNTSAGSTMDIIHLGTNGYGDINFFTGNNGGNMSSISLRFALGVGMPGVNVPPYNHPYLEDYANEGFSFVGGGGGNLGYWGLYAASGTPNFYHDWVGYQAGATNLWFDADQQRQILHVADIDCTNIPTFQTTNSAPANTNGPRIWIPFTNNGAVFKLPAYQ